MLARLADTGVADRPRGSNPAAGNEVHPLAARLGSPWKSHQLAGRMNGIAYQ
jgi:hypothetical protein